MAEFILSPSMSLPIPVVSVAPGPDYAQFIDNCLTIVDGHTHAFGSGVPVTPAGLNISTDLSMQLNNLTAVRTVRFSPQLSPISAVSPDLGILYESGVDLWYNDGLGNQVRITASGGVAGSPGSISNLTSPASASYSAGSQTFIWQSNVNTAANMDMGSIILRDISASSFGVTISPPIALANDYSLTLPAALPGSTSFLTVDNSGNIGASISAVNPFISTNNIQDGAVTLAKTAAPNMVISPSSGALLITAIANVLSATITLTGRPVMISFQADGTTTFSNIFVNQGVLMFITRTGTPSANIGYYEIGSNTPGTFYGPSCINTYDLTGYVGTVTYTLAMAPSASGGYSFGLNQVVMVVREL